jgi:hypothetical protein
LFTVEALDTAGFLKKVREYDSRLESKRRGELTAAQKDELDRYENQIVSLTGWLVLSYAGPPETTNCASPIFHDWHLEIFENPSDHAPRMAIRLRLFAKSRRAQSAPSTATACAFNRLLDFSGYRT